MNNSNCFNVKTNCLNKQNNNINDASESSIIQIVHERIEIFHPIQMIIDTREFQRLRYIRQLGLVYLVYPAADHCRFTHSLGVYSLAFNLIKELAESQPNLNITSQDKLCICIAALIHDIGHGPFSHFYEIFLNIANPNNSFKHELNSKKIFRQMLKKYDDLRQALEEYLSKKDFIFIEELIDPPTPFILNSEWQLKGRSIEKSFLYSILNNKLNGFDIDKFDYFLRDSLIGNVPIPFSKITISRIFSNAKVLLDKSIGFKCLVFAKKNLNEIRDTFEARVMLHDRIYRHKTIIGLEIFVTKILLSAVNYFKIRGDDNKFYKLTEIYQNHGAFLSVDDRILFMLQNSITEELNVTRELIHDLEKRKLPKFVCCIPIDNYENKTITEESIKQKFLSICPFFDEFQIMVQIFFIHRGLGIDKCPIDLVQVYTERNNIDCQIEEINKVWFKYNTTKIGGKAEANIYIYNVSEEQINSLKNISPTLEKVLSI